MLDVSRVGRIMTVEIRMRAGVAAVSDKMRKYTNCEEIV